MKLVLPGNPDCLGGSPCRGLVGECFSSGGDQFRGTPVRHRVSIDGVNLQAMKNVSLSLPGYPGRFPRMHHQEEVFSGSGMRRCLQTG